MTINKPTAIQWKYNIQCSEVNGVLQDFSSALTEEQINTAVSEYETYLISIQYQKDRAKKYPTWQDQMDMQYKDLLNGTTTWKDAIAKVKSDNPKG
tara:strand:- start:56 stop:343 length:288 start_codon:yes stop_codon:yes gene_type:complete